MLENMNRLIEKMDALSKSLKIYAPKSNKRRSIADFRKQFDAVTGGKNISSCSPATTTKIDNLDLCQNLNEDIKKIIEKYSKEYNVEPLLIQQLITVASGNNPNAVGRNGQLGLMQLNPWLSKRYSLTNPFDPAQNISAGTRHLSELIQNNNGNLSLALAAYNTDPLTVKRFGGVPPYSETQNFVNQILSGLGK